MKNDYIVLLKNLIQIVPVSSDPAAVGRAVEVLYSFLTERGIACTMENSEGHPALYASTRPGKLQKILFNAHLDVVPPLDKKQSEPEIRGERLYGRGAYDCLGNAVAVAAALCSSQEYSAAALFTGDEEIGGNSIPPLLKRGFGAERAVVVTDHYEKNKITCRQKGILVLKLTAGGAGGHAAYVMENNLNPLDSLAEAYLSIRKQWHNPSSPEDWGDSLNGTVFSGGRAVNQIPSEAFLILNIRYTETGGSGKILERIRDMAGNKVAVTEERRCEPFESDSNAPELQILKRCWERVTGASVGFCGMCGATDARHFKGLGLPVAILSVEGAGAHSASEYVSMPSIDEVAAIDAEYIRAINASQNLHQEN